MIMDLNHPVTIYLNRLNSETQWIEFGKLPLEHKKAIFKYMHAGVWGDHVDDLYSAIETYGNVIFGYGNLVNDDNLKRVIAATSVDYDVDSDELESWFTSTYLSNSFDQKKFRDIEPEPVILSPVNLACEFGMFENPDIFNEYWVHKTIIEYVSFTPGWKTLDPSGRGGQ